MSLATIISDIWNWFLSFVQTPPATPPPIVIPPPTPAAPIIPPITPNDIEQFMCEYECWNLLIPHQRAVWCQGIANLCTQLRALGPVTYRLLIGTNENHQLFSITVAGSTTHAISGEIRRLAPRLRLIEDASSPDSVDIILPLRLIPDVAILSEIDPEPNIKRIWKQTWAVIFSGVCTELFRKYRVEPLRSIVSDDDTTYYKIVVSGVAKEAIRDQILIQYPKLQIDFVKDEADEHCAVIITLSQIDPNTILQ